MRELTKWYTEGIAPAELDYRKDNLVGSFKVSLATTEGMAASLLAAKHRGYDQTWLDQYPDKIKAITLGEVNSAIKAHLKPDSMVMIKAGTIPGSTPAAN